MAIGMRLGALAIAPHEPSRCTRLDRRPRVVAGRLFLASAWGVRSR